MGPTDIGKELRRLRQLGRLTLQQVADAAGLGVSTVCEVEKSGPDRPLPPAATRIADVLGRRLVVSYYLAPARRRERSR